MILQSSDQTHSLRVIPRFGDIALFIQLMRSKIWQQFYTGDKKPWWTILVWIINAKIEMFALVFRSLFRYNMGKHTTGFIFLVWSFTLLAAFNAQHSISFLVSFIPFIAPGFIFFIPSDELYSHLFIEVRSQILLVLMVLFLLVQSIHVIRLYMTKNGNQSGTKRGSSWLKTSIPIIKKCSEYLIQGIIEPVLILLFGWLGFEFFQDTTFFAFSGISALCLFYQEFYEKAFQENMTLK